MALPGFAFRAHELCNRLVYRADNRYARLRRIVSRQRPRTILEIGVWRGQRAREFIDIALAFHPPHEVKYFGFDLFETMPPDLVQYEASRRSTNPSREVVLKDLAPLVRAGVHVELVAGNTVETLRNRQLPLIDFAFIDGGHSYETVKSDWANVSQSIGPGSTVVFDDFVNTAAVRHEGFGVNQLVEEIDRSRYDVRTVGPVDWWAREWGILKNQLAVVRVRQL